jgi:hypothetical protein
MKFPTGPIVKKKSEDDETKKQAASASQKRKNRRTKADTQGRSHKCGCGKMYLSYPALYTHIKTKHDGIPMEGHNVPQFKNGRRGRGRPRKQKETTAPVYKLREHPADNIRNNPNFSHEIYFARELGHLDEKGSDAYSDFPMLYRANERLEHPIKIKLREMIEKQVEI